MCAKLRASERQSSQEGVACLGVGVEAGAAMKPLVTAREAGRATGNTKYEAGLRSIASRFEGGHQSRTLRGGRASP